VNPAVACWFKQSAEHLLASVAGYVNLLDRYDIQWTEIDRARHDPL
jgi:hypothetical protein